MIIHAIRAENFMRFSSLHISNLPSRGIIGIEGSNESGKTTIGEAVLFALFGRTRASQEMSVSRLIRWGADYLSVELEFDVPGRGQFLIYREIDKYGTNFVKIIDRNTRAEIASGNVNVSEFLARASKFDYYEFHQSFYHDQTQNGLARENPTGFVERMTGIAQIQEAMGSLKKDIEQLEREFSHFHKDVQRNLQQIEKHEKNESKLPDLHELARGRSSEHDRLKSELARRRAETEALQQLSEERQEVARRVESLVEEGAPALERELGALRPQVAKLAEFVLGSPEFVERLRADSRSQGPRLDAILAMLRDYQSYRRLLQDSQAELDARLDPASPSSAVSRERELASGLERLVGAARRGGMAAFFACLFALVLGGGAVALFVGIELPLPSDALSAATVRWSLAGASGLLIVAAGCVLVWRSRILRRARDLQLLHHEESVRIRIDTEERTRVNGLLAIRGAGDAVRVIKGAEALQEPGLADSRREFLRKHASLVEPEGENEYRKALISLARIEKEIRSRALRDAQRAEKAVSESDAAVKKLRGELDRAENEIRECESQAAKKAVLLGKNRDLMARAQEIRNAIDLRRVSIELLEDAVCSIRNKIGPSFSRHLREVLPRLTAGRYRDIKVTSDLGLQIFTSEKSDFLDPAELSGGTHEALGLAMRMAVSQAFISTRTHQAQFIFLDEPFKMMDETRTLDTLRMIPELSKDLSQVFVVQPNFTTEQREEFDYLVSVAPQGSQLEVTGPGQSPQGRSAQVLPESGSIADAERASRLPLSLGDGLDREELDGRWRAGSGAEAPAAPEPL